MTDGELFKTVATCARCKLDMTSDGWLKCPRCGASLSGKAESFHLAEYLEDEMLERGWTMTDLVMNMGPHFTPEAWGICQLSWEMFFAVREPYVILGDVMAAQLETAFDVPAEFFMNMHKTWRKHQPVAP